MSSRSINQCEPCHYRGASTTAVKYCKSCNEFLCKDCADFHKSFKVTRDHFLANPKDKDDMNLYRDLLDIRSCKQHAHKTTEFYCIQHSEMLCSLCLLQSAHHSTCADKIVEIQNLGKSLLGSQFVETLREDIHRIISRSQHAIIEVHKEKEETKKTVETFKCQVKTLRAKILAVFDRQTEQMVQKATETSERVENEYIKTIKNFEKLNKPVVENKTLFESVIESGSAEDVFRCIFSTVEQLEDFKVAIEKLDKDSHKNEVFIVKGDLLQSLEENDEPLVDYKIKKTNVKWLPPSQIKISKGEFKNHVVNFQSLSTGNSARTLGQNGSVDKGSDSCLHAEPTSKDTTVVEKDTSIKSGCRESSNTDGNKKSGIVPESLSNSSDNVLADERKDKFLSLATKPKNAEAKLLEKKFLLDYQEIKLSHDYSFDVPTEDKKCPWVGGIAVLKNNTIIVSDFMNSKLILTNEDRQAIVVKSLQYPPGQVTLIKDEYLAVCLKKTNQILLFDVNADPLRESKYVQTTYHPKCVQAVDDNMLVSCQDGAGNWYLYLMTTKGEICREIEVLGLYDGHKIAVQTLPDQNENFRIIQCCEITDKLQCFESDGSFVFGFDIDKAADVVTDINGYIYVVRFSGEIRVYSPNGDFLLKLYSPTMVKAKFAAFSPSCNKLFVTTYKDSRVHVVNVKRTKTSSI